MNAVIQDFVYGFLVFVIGWSIARELPKTFPKRIADGVMTSEQAAKTAKFSRIGGYFLMMLAVAYLVFVLVLRFR